MGPANEGDEILSLADSFHSIGVRHLVATLWEVRDESASKLVEAFYRFRSQGMDDPDALAAAKREALADPARAHPAHWAGFVLYRPGW